MEAYQWLRIFNTGIGCQYGRWLQIGPEFRIGHKYAVLQCTNCGITRVGRMDHCRNGKSDSCRNGCDSHGMSGTPEHRIWLGMIERCERPRHVYFANYGGRGISVAAEWKGPNGFMRFLEHVGRRPSPEMQLDRIDNDGNYEPGNVRWATALENNQNKRTNVNITIDGVTKCASEWARQPGAIEVHRIYERLARGWSPRDAVFKKSNRKRSRANESLLALCSDVFCADGV